MKSHIIFAAVLLAIISSARAATVTYDPAVGTLPTAQGWTLTELNSPPAPSVIAQALHQGLVQVGDAQYYSQALVTDFTTNSVFADLELQVISSSFGFPSNLPRTGYYLIVRDVANRNFLLGIASDRVILQNDSSSPSLNQFLMDTTAQFHNYHLAVDNTGAVLSVDGIQRITLALGSSDSGSSSSVLFGAITNAESSETRLKGVTVGTVPEPSSTILLLSGALFCLRRRSLRTHERNG